MKNFILKHNVPILDEHILYGEDGEEIATIDEKKLNHIADLANKRVKETGDLVPIIIGHTKDDTQEEEQPEIVGYASGFKVQRFFKTGRKAITATFKFFKQYLNKIKKYPRRSIELWLNDWKIDPISLLGATTPERDLGLLQLSKKGSRRFLIQYQEKKPMQENSEQKKIVDAVMKALQETDVWKWACQQMKTAGESSEGDMTPGEEMEDQDMDMEGAEMGGEEGQHTPFGDEELGDEEEASQDLENPEEAEDGEEPMRYSAAGFPSGGNSYVTGTDQSTKKGLAAMKTRAKMKKDQNRVQKFRYEKRLAHLEAVNKDLRIKFQRAERERDLIQLEAEGVDFDREEELEDVLEMPETLYQKHLQKMRVRYQKAPLFQGGEDNPFSQSRAATGSGLGDRKALTDQAVALATEKQISFSQALELIGG